MQTDLSMFFGVDHDLFWPMPQFIFGISFLNMRIVHSCAWYGVSRIHGNLDFHHSFLEPEVCICTPALSSRPFVSFVLRQYVLLYTEG